MKDSIELLNLDKAEFENIGIKTYKRKKEIIKSIKESNKNITKNELVLIDRLINKISYTEIILEELEARITSSKESYKNGKEQYGTKTNSDINLYASMSKLHNQSISILFSYLNAAKKLTEKEESKRESKLDRFLKNDDANEITLFIDNKLNELNNNI